MKKSVKYLLTTIIAATSLECAAQSDLDFYVMNQKNNRHEAVIYPNPTTGNVVKIKSTSLIKEVEIMSIIGKNIQNEENKLHIYDDMTIVLDSKEPGMYLAKITFEDDQVVVKKLIVKQL